MKPKLLGTWKQMVLLAALPFVGASFESSQPVTTASTLAGADVDLASFALDNPSDEMAQDSPSGLPEAPAPAAAPVPLGPAPVVPDLRLSSAALEIVKLAQSGVDESVMLAYIANATSPFNLNPDQIVYLNDIGISGAVIKAMIERDRSFNPAFVAMMPSATNPPPVAAYPPDQTAAGYPPGQPAQPPMTTTPADYPAGPVDDSGNYATADDSGYFYDSLAPYGSWSYVAGYGVCWQPTVVVVNAGWRPYWNRGRWVYSNCGWYWQSDYSWGWAAFHYGRWCEAPNHGWIWVPNRVWGPAWVSWRHSPEYCGWAPLPPAARFQTGVGFQFNGHGVTAGFEFGLSAGLYAFIPINRMGDPSPWRFGIAGTQSTRIYNQTTVINNFTVENNKIFNHGIDPKTVESVSGVHLRRAEIADLPKAGARNLAPDRLEHRGDTTVIYRPQLPVTPPRHPASLTGSAVAPATQQPAPGNAATRTPGNSAFAPAGVGSGVRAAPAAATASATSTANPTDPKPHITTWTRPDAPRSFTGPNPTAPAPTTPRTDAHAPNSLIITGRPNATPGNQDPAAVRGFNQGIPASPQPRITETAPSYNNYTPPPAYVAPRYTPPAPVQSYSPPPQQHYSAPVQAPAQSYSPPPAPAPAQAPAQSSSSSSSSSSPSRR